MLYTIFLLLVSELSSNEAIAQDQATGLGWSGWLILFILLVLSNIAVFIFFERLVIIKKALKKEDHFLNSIKDFLHDGKRSSALERCINSY
jgi:biopolymer transport protein ExbB